MGTSVGWLVGGLVGVLLGWSVGALVGLNETLRVSWGDGINVGAAEFDGGASCGAMESMSELSD